MLKQLLALVLFSSFVFPQSGDSLLIQNNQNKFDTSLVEITDTLLTSDTTKTAQTIAKADSLIPIQGQPLSDMSTIISRNTFLFENYRYTGDLLRSFNVYFIKDLGFIGYPNESFIYGVGNGAVSYMLDGVLWNNRYTNSLDLNQVQSEDIDSIEIVPSPRGFLYGPYNNPVTVNFITRDFITPVPYARIKYYQGPNAEAMIDGRFSALIAKRWNLSFEITNRSIDSTYTNTEFSFWNINAKLKYFLSNSVNITGWYYYVDTKQGLNGGVNVDSIASIPPSYNIDMYSPEAPVVYPNRKLDVLQNSFGLRTLAKPFDNSELDLSIYYRYEKNIFGGYNNEFNSTPQFENKTFGALLNAEQKISVAKIGAIISYEKNSINYTQPPTLGFTDDAHLFSITPIVSFLLLDGKLIPSIFYKYLWSEHVSSGRIRYDNLSGLGVDLIYHVFQNIKIYGGYSNYECLSCQENVKNAEVSINYSDLNFLIDLKWFKRNNLFFYEKPLPSGYSISYPQFGNLSGLGLNLKYNFWYLLVETSTAYYFKPQEDKIYGVPEFSFIGGIFVNGNFFNDNLNLKTGFRFYYFGNNNVFTKKWGIENVNPTNKLDFTLAGEIKKVAIFYFIWENIYYNQYYITPYYPMPDGNIRFGIAWELFN